MYYNCEVVLVMSVGSETSWLPADEHTDSTCGGPEIAGPPAGCPQVTAVPLCCGVHEHETAH